MPTTLELELLHRAARITQAERQATDPLRLWHPIVKAQPFIDSVLHPEVSGLWENWYVGANRSSRNVHRGVSAAPCWPAMALSPFIRPIPRSPMAPRWRSRTRPPRGGCWAWTRNTNRDIIQPRYFDNGYLKPGMPEPFIPAREVARVGE